MVYTTPPLLNIAKGALVVSGGNEYSILAISDLSTVVAKNLENGKIESLPIAHLSPPKLETAETSTEDIDLEEISDSDWEAARGRLEIIQPLLKRRERGLAVADSISMTTGYSRSILYEWAVKYRNTLLLSALLPYRPRGGQGKPRIKDPAIEELLRQTVEEYYETPQQPSLTEAYEHLVTLCGEQKPPHLNTLRKRIEWRAEREKLEKRKGRKRAIELYDPILGQIPDAEWPLAIVQIDHTLLPVIIVDDDRRESIKRAWVTFAIDVFSRVVLGMYLALEAPSAMSAGLCISHAILPKENWLAENNVSAEWPCWGVMGALHMDNAREFRGDMLKVACDEYAIDIFLRPVKTPHYGAHIERLMGTVSQKLKRVPGATFSGTSEKGEYDAEGNAILTFTELERWLINFVAEYNHAPHSGIDAVPLNRYREGLLGTRLKPGRGLPARRLDSEKVYIDFMPFHERTIQDYGVLIDDVYYYTDALRLWINSKDPENPKARRLFRFRRDPRDISKLYFFDPQLKRYYIVPYRDISRPPITIWELRAAKAAARQAGVKEVDEAAIFRYAQQLRNIESDAAAKKKSARRMKQKRVEHERSRTKQAKALPITNQTVPGTMPSAPPLLPGIQVSDIQAFDDEY